MISAMANSIDSLSLSFTEVKSVKYKGTTKDATCDITVEYSGSDVIQSGSSVSCTIGWPKSEELDKDVNINVLVGDVLDQCLDVAISFNLFKKAKKGSSTTKTKDVSFSGEIYQAEDPASYPADLW